MKYLFGTSNLWVSVSHIGQIRLKDATNNIFLLHLRQSIWWENSTAMRYLRLFWFQTSSNFTPLSSSTSSVLCRARFGSNSLWMEITGDSQHEMKLPKLDPELGIICSEDGGKVGAKLFCHLGLVRKRLQRTVSSWFALKVPPFQVEGPGWASGAGWPSPWEEPV